MRRDCFSAEWRQIRFTVLTYQRYRASMFLLSCVLGDQRRIYLMFLGVISGNRVTSGYQPWCFQAPTLCFLLVFERLGGATRHLFLVYSYFGFSILLVWILSYFTQLFCSWLVMREMPLGGLMLLATVGRNCCWDVLSLLCLNAPWFALIRKVVHWWFVILGQSLLLI